MRARSGSQYKLPVVAQFEFHGRAKRSFAHAA
jgi:hypothetical protein